MSGTFNRQNFIDVDAWQGGQRARDFLRIAPLAPLSTLGGSAVVTLCLWPVLPTPAWPMWLASAMLVALAQWQMRRFVRGSRSAKSADRHELTRRRWVVASALAAGVFWGVTSILLFPSGSAVHQLLLAFILAAIAALWLPFFALVRVSVLAFTVPAVLPMAFALLTSPQAPQTTMGSLLLLLIGALAALAQVANRILFAESAARESLYHQATHDALVGLANRAEFHRRAQTLEIMRARAYAIVFIDLDHFKEVNDSAGHAAGDELLCEIGAILRRTVRKMDTPARLGGDEFAILMEDCGAPEAAEVAATILEQIRAVQLRDASACRRVTASIGIACSADLCASPAKLLEAADQACYRAKRAGRNRIDVATGRVSAPSRARDRAQFALLTDPST